MLWMVLGEGKEPKWEKYNVQNMIWIYTFHPALGCPGDGVHNRMALWCCTWETGITATYRGIIL